MRYKFRSKLSSVTKAKRRKYIPIILIFFLMIAYIVIVLLLPWPKFSGNPTNITLPPTNTAKIIWPARGQAAVGAVGFGVLTTNGDQSSAPIASIAKTALALSVLKQKPLSAGQPGPTITITKNDVDLYKAYLAQNGSVFPVQLKEELSEYQMLQALLLPSGDNIADTLAIWGFGSVSNYLNYANQLTQDLGLTQTHIADASGLEPKTVSSARDLVVLGENILKEPVLAEIVNQSKTKLPLEGEVRNYNTLLGQENIIGIKTGNTDEAGGCFLFAAKNNIQGKDVTITGAILGAKSRNDALQESLAFLQNNVRNFQLVTVVKAGQMVGTYNLPWGKVVNVVAKNDLSVLVVNGEKVSMNITLSKINKVTNKGEEVGTVTIKSGSEEVTVPGVLADKITKPPILWRLIHP